ncbi:DUF4445 domain-containing protein [bacterium]|nr:DUF4445 domain-containing protein [bacterium]
MAGAIQHVACKAGGISYQVIGGGRPLGICGSGLVDACAALLQAGFIEPSGRFISNTKRLSTETRVSLCRIGGQPAFTFDGNSAITQEDIRKAQLAKSAIRTCIEILLQEAEIEPASVGSLILGGAFGSFIDPKSAEAIGLVPKFENASKSALGNTALAGAIAFLRSGSTIRKLEALRRTSTYVNLATHPDFERLFTDYMEFG